MGGGVGVGVATLELYEAPDAGGGGAPDGEDEGDDGECDAASEDVIPNVIGGDDAGPEFPAVVRVGGVEAFEVVFRVVDHRGGVGAPGARRAHVRRRTARRKLSRPRRAA
jgi:hypothetical protein